MTDGTAAWSHEPAAYDCPFCRLQRGVHNDLNRAEDVVAVTDLAYARISPRWWPANPGAALVIPREHHENLYDLPPATGHAVWDLTQRVAVAMRGATPAPARRPDSTTSPPAARTCGTSTCTCSPGTTATELYERHRDSGTPTVPSAPSTPSGWPTPSGLPRTFG
jgi:histidine triad (HIT) family protein